MGEKIRTALNISDAIRIGLAPWRTKVPLNGAEWADKHFYLSPESSGIAGRWKSHAYQIGPLNWMTCDDIEEVNWMKSRRVGYTKCLLASCGCMIEQKNRNIAVWQPTDGDAHDFVTDEVETMIRDVPVMGEKLRCQVGVKSKYNTVEKKVFFGATWDIKGGKSARNFRRMTKDVAIYDELSAFDPDIDGEGSATELGDGRLDQAPFPKSIRGSTPKIKGFCQIEAAVNGSDMIVRRFIKCKHCGQLQPLEPPRKWREAIGLDPKREYMGAHLEYDNDDPETAHFVCLNGCKMYYRELVAMDAAGRWQSDDGRYYIDKEDRFCDGDGNPISKPRRIGAHIWAAYSRERSWSWLVDKFIQAKKEWDDGKLTAMKTFVNTLLGETWEDIGEKIDIDIFDDDRLENYTPDSIPNGVLVITIGADVQGGKDARLELEVVGWGLGQESWSIDYVILPGDPEQDTVWEHLEKQFLRHFTRQDGVILTVLGGMVDSGYLPSRVYNFTRPRRWRNIFATKGASRYTGPLVGKGSWQGEKGKKTLLYTINTDEGKETLFARMNKLKLHGPGFCHFPAHYKPDHFIRLTNEEKRIKKKAGRIVGYEWVKLGPNEQIDCRVLAMAALSKIHPNLSKIKAKLSVQSASIEQGAHPKPMKMAPKKRKVRSRGIE